MFSFRVIGTPSSAERGSCARQRASAERASLNAVSALTRYMALIRGSQCAMRSSCARATSTGESSPRAKAAPSSAAESSWIAAIVPDYTRRRDDKNAGARAHRASLAAHGERGERGALVACARCRDGCAARAPSRRLPCKPGRVSRAPRAARHGAGQAPGSPRAAAQHGAPGALLHPRRLSAREAESAGRTEDLVRDGADARPPGRLGPSLRLHDGVARVGNAGELGWRAQPPADGALDLDAGVMGEGRLFRL